ncbi:hypothetical protein WN943_010864 [Citrus x changshan-huyou]
MEDLPLVLNVFKMRIQSHQGHDQGPCLFLGFFLDENILEHMAKGNLGLLVREEFAEGNVLVRLKIIDIEKKMIQRNHMVMVKRCVEDLWLVWRNMVEFYKEVLQGSLDMKILFETGNVRDCHPFITLFLGPKVSGMRILKIWTVNDKNRSELLSFLIWKVEKVV